MTMLLVVLSYRSACVAGAAMLASVCVGAYGAPLSTSPVSVASASTFPLIAE